jgi:chitodextrinase
MAIVVSILAVPLIYQGLGSNFYANAAAVTPPTTPKNLKASVISDTQINLSWSASTSKVGIAGYNVYMGGNKVATTTQNQTTYASTGLQPKTSYSYTVSAIDIDGNTSAQTSAVSAKTQADTTPPTVPTNFVRNKYCFHHTDTDLVIFS